MIALFLATALAATPTATQADELFTRAKAELKAGRVKEACGLFAESHRLEPALGALLNLASCYEQQGRLASAFLRFNEAEAWAARVSDRPRRELAAERSAALKSKLAWLALTATTPVVGEVARVGTEPEAPLGGAPLVVPVDSGLVHVTVSAPGMQAWSADIDAPAPGTTRSLAVPALVSLKPAIVVLQPSDAPTTQKSEPIITAATEPAPILVQQPRVISTGPSSGAVVLTAVSATVAAAGAAGLIWTFVSLDELDAQKTGRIAAWDNEAIVARLNTMRVVYPAAWAAAGVGAAGTLVGAILCATTSKTTTVGVVPTRDGATLTVRGEF